MDKRRLNEWKAWEGQQRKRARGEKRGSELGNTLRACSSSACTPLRGRDLPAKAAWAIASSHAPSRFPVSRPETARGRCAAAGPAGAGLL